MQNTEERRYTEIYTQYTLMTVLFKILQRRYRNHSGLRRFLGYYHNNTIHYPVNYIVCTDPGAWFQKQPLKPITKTLLSQFEQKLIPV